MTTPATPTTTHEPASAPLDDSLARHTIERLVLASFLLTFLIARSLVILIMDHRLPPQLFFHMQGTHVHHLNYGIILLSVSGALSLFARPQGKKLEAVAVIYGIGLALTFDEFGMWLHLGGLYWQRASFDAVIAIAALLALIAYGSTIRRWRPHHHLTLAAVVISAVVFAFLLIHSYKWANEELGPMLQNLEQSGPS